MRILVCGNANHFPFAPAVKRNWPMETQNPIAMVTTSFLMYCMVS